MGTVFRIKTEFERARLCMISEFDYIEEKSSLITNKKTDNNLK